MISYLDCFFLEVGDGERNSHRSLCLSFSTVTHQSSILSEKKKEITEKERT